jgi:serine/threonine-protein kinase CTR1
VLKLLYDNISMPDVNRLYTEIDRNRSGRITFDEFVQAVIKYSWDLTRIVPRTNRGSVKAGAAADTDEQDEPFEWEIDVDQIQMGKMIGEGTFGTVYRAKWQGCPIAVKQLRLNSISKNVRRDFRHEISLMSRMRHPLIVLFMGATTVGDKLAIITELVDGGSLYDIIHKTQAQFTLRWALKVVHETAVAMNYLHSRTPPIVHRDLKPMNILVDRTSSRIKLIDFGLSCIKPSKDILKEIVGSPIWMAPELLRGETYTEKVDVYSFALCLWELFTGETPYIKLSFAELVERVGGEDYRPPIAREVPSGVRMLIEQCWHSAPAMRPSFREIVDAKLFTTGSQ